MSSSCEKMFEELKECANLDHEETGAIEERRDEAVCEGGEHGDYGKEICALEVRLRLRVRTARLKMVTVAYYTSSHAEVHSHRKWSSSRRAADRKATAKSRR